MRPTELLLVGAALPLAAVSGWQGSRMAHRSWAPFVERALVALTQLPPQEVSVDRVSLAWPLAVRLSGVRIGAVRLDETRLFFSPAALLRGATQPERIEAAKLQLAGRGELARLSWHNSAGGASAPGRTTEVRFERAHLEHHQAILDLRGGAVSLVGRQPRRVAFYGARLGFVGGSTALEELAGSASVDDAHRWQLSASREGLTVTAAIDPSGVGELSVSCSALPLASLQPLLTPLFGPQALSLATARATGSLRVASAGVNELRLSSTLDLDGLRVHHPRVSALPLEGLAVHLAASAAREAGQWRIESLQFSRGALVLEGSGSLSPGGPFSVELKLRKAACGELLRSFPAAALPALEGLRLEGSFAGQLALSGALDRLDDLDHALDLNLQLQNGCTVVADPPLAEVRALKTAAPLVARALDAEGRPRQLLLGAGAPGYRSLASLPPHVVRPFLVAEDARFFTHHGFDLEMVRRALTSNLAVGEIKKGASTLSQQLVKNLFLSNERSWSRKLEEVVLTWRLEQVLDKERILELYLNLAELGPGIYGLHEAAERYLGKLPEELSQDEAAQLAALLPAPRRGMDEAWRVRYEQLRQRVHALRLTLYPPVRRAELLKVAPVTGPT